MNPIFKAAAESTDAGVFLGVMTVLFLSTYLFWVWWAYRPAHSGQMESWGRMPLEDDGPGGDR